MKSRNVVLLALAIGCGLVAAFLTAKLGASGKTDTVQILVASKNIDQGTRLDKPEDFFVRKPFTKDAVPPEYIDDLNLMKGKILQRTLRPGSHITNEDITPHTEVELPIDEKTGQKYMAMGIKVNQETGGGGLVKPGSRVDVVCVERLPNGRSASTLILQHALVVSVNDQLKRDFDSPGVIKNMATVTLAVKQQEGLVLALATKRGELSLLLRSKDDNSKTAKVRTIDTLAGERRDDDGNLTQPEYPTVPVAIKPIPPGTKIDDPAQWFEERKVLEVPRNAVASLADLKGKTVKKEIFENAWVATEVFEGEILVSRSDAPRNRVGIQIGSNAPEYFTYKQGALQASDERKPDKEIKPEAPKSDGAKN